MFGALRRIAMLGQVPLMGQINSGFSWNTAPGGWNPYVPAAPAYVPQQAAAPAEIPNAYGGAPAYAPQQAAAPAGSCFTCVNPSTGEAQYGVPAAMANQLKGQGYRCRADDCAQRSQASAPPAFFPGIVGYGSPVATGTFTDGFAPSEGGIFGLSARIPVQRGIGSRALGGW